MTLVAVAIPLGALRRTWLAGNLGAVRYGAQMAALIRQLDPAARPDMRKPDECYRLLLEAAAHLFPVYDAGMWDIEDFAYLFDYGIPIAPAGFTPDIASAAIAFVAACLDWANEGHTTLALAADVYPALEGLRLPWWAGPIRDGQSDWWSNWMLPPPRGRAWSGRWAVLPELVDYVMARTGNAWLDYASGGELDGMEMPLWNIGEVRALEHAWKQAEAALARLHTLTDWIDQEPESRLRLLYDILRGDPEAVRAATRARREPSLAEVLG